MNFIKKCFVYFKDVLYKILKELVIKLKKSLNVN